MTMEERTPTTEERLEALEGALASENERLEIADLRARLFKLEALLGDEDVTAGLEAMSFTRRMNRYVAEETAIGAALLSPAEDGTAPIDAKTP